MVATHGAEQVHYSALILSPWFITRVGEVSDTDPIARLEYWKSQL